MLPGKSGGRLRILNRTVLVAVFLVMIARPSTVIQAAGGQRQLDQGVIARALLGQDKQVRNRAFEAVLAIVPADIGPELRTALITLLERSNQIPSEARRRGVAVSTLDDPEFISSVSRFVADLRDPRAIPALAEATYGWVTVMRSLAAFGEQAAPAVLRIVTSPDSHYELQEHGLITLRFMIERADVNPLSPATVEQIRLAAEQHLTGKPYFTTLWHAMDLAFALRDPNLRRIIESLASNRNAIIARGVDDPKVIELTQKRAADRLAGVLPVPRP